MIIMDWVVIWSCGSPPVQQGATHLFLLKELLVHVLRHTKQIKSGKRVTESRRNCLHYGVQNVHEIFLKHLKKYEKYRINNEG